MRKFIVVLLLTALLLIYISSATFSYFSDIETITVELTAATPPSSVSILYDNATLTVLCHNPCCQGSSGDGSQANEVNIIKNLTKRASNNPQDLEQAPSCFRKICNQAILDGISIEVKGREVFLKKVVVKWWNGGKLDYLKIDNQTFEANFTSPARVRVETVLEGGLHQLKFSFREITSPVFEIKFVFEDYKETIYFVPCIKFKWV